jgi:hypothetical protein
VPLTSGRKERTEEFGKVHRVSKQSKRMPTFSIHTVRCSVQTHPFAVCRACKQYSPIAIRSMVQGSRKQRAAPQPSKQRAAKLQLRRTSIAHEMYEDENTTRVRSIVLRFLSRPCGTTVEPRPEPLPLPLPDIMKPCYVQPSGGLHVWLLCKDAAFVSQSRKRPLVRFNPSRISSCCELMNNCSCKSPG